MHQRLKVSNVWRTAEGVDIPVSKMASSHLLAAIHLIERGRYQRVTDAAMRQGEEPLNDELVGFYLEWPIQYEALIKEAVYRNLIYRPIENAAPSAAMVKSFKGIRKRNG